MKVRMTRNSVTPLRKGEVYDLPDDAGQRLITLNAAVAEDSDPASKKGDSDPASKKLAPRRKPTSGSTSGAKADNGASDPA